VEIPADSEFLRNQANIDRMAAILRNNRLLNRDHPMESKEELALLFKAAQVVDDAEDLKMMWALLMLREVNRRDE
jgi:hypothetical protein